MSSYKTPQEIALFAAQTGERKATLPPLAMVVLGFLGGAFIALGFLLDIRVIATVPKEWGSFASFLVASVFSLGLIMIIIGGGELVTGNMMTVTLAGMTRQISWGRVLGNLIVITITNFIGAIFVAYFFGHVVGLTETAAFLTKTVAVAKAKLDESFVVSFFSAIGCNWLVGMAVWLSYSAETIGGKILAIWFPVMGFVAIGFQHVVANMFVIPAAIFAGHATWGQYFSNFVPVYLGNLIGGMIMVSGIYYLSYLREQRS